MSASPSRIQSAAAAVPVVVVVGATGGAITGNCSEHHDSGIDNCNSSDTSNCCHTQDHDREEDATTATTLTTTTHRDMGDSSSSSSGTEDNVVEEDLADGDACERLRREQRRQQMHAMSDELADYEIVESTEEVKVAATVTRPKAGHNTTTTTTCGGASIAATAGEISPAEVKRLENNNNKIATSKEEKQRQNEEIIILESSSVSSETGSWESVSPEQLLQIQQQVVATTTTSGNNSCAGLSDLTPVNVSDAPAAVAASSGATLSDYDAKPIRTACFIDASSLLDESELAALTSAQQLQSAGQRDKSEALTEEPSIITKKVDYEIKDQFSSGEFTPLQLSGNSSAVLDTSMNSSSGSGGEGGGRKSSSPPKTSFKEMDTKESEKFKGGLVFRNSINQYSGVLIEDPESDQNLDSHSREQEGGGESIPATQSYPLRNARSDFNSLLDIYQENKRHGGSAGGGFKFNYMRTQSENHAMEPQSIILPDTPHNSILNVNLIQGCGTEEQLVQRNRLRSRSKEEDSADDAEQHFHSVDENRTPKRHLKFMECAPIVSGGVSVVDFSPKLCESPPVRRKLDTCPILSGFSSQDDVGVFEEPAKPVVRPTESTSFKSWVIDLNDLPKTGEEKKGEVQGSAEKPLKDTSQSMPTRKFSGFYVSLDDVPPPAAAVSGASDSGAVAETKKEGERVCQSATTSMKKSTGFFVDLAADKEEEQKSNAQEKEKLELKSGEENKDASEDKKNMFCMFFDIGERKPVPKKESLTFSSKLSESINRRKEMERRSESPKSSTDRLNAGAEKCSSLTFVPLDRGEHISRGSGSGGDEVQMRPKFRSSMSEDRQRHATKWSESNRDTMTGNAERPISFTAGDKGLMSIIDKIPLLSKTSSMSIDSSISPLEDFTCSKSELSTFSTSATSNSNNSSTKELSQQLKVLGGDMCSVERKRQKDVKINETYDKSSQSSITDGALSKDLSPVSTATNTEDVTYQNDVMGIKCPEEERQPQPIVETIEVAKVKSSIAEGGLSTIQEANEKLASPAKIRFGGRTVLAKEEEESEEGKLASQEAKHTMETLQATIEKQRKLLLETVNETVETTSFVRLSDMDKPFQSFEIYSSGGVGHGGGSGLMGSSSLTKSGGDRRSRSMASGGGHDSLGVQGNYYEKSRHNNMYYSTDTNIINLASSFENSQTLSRIFPHLSKVFSSSLPANVGLENMPSELTSMSSDLSANSSVTSSCIRSVQDSGDESSIFCRLPRRLGEDLLKMFLHEIGTDVTIDIGHRKLKAHKCILQSRCQYFAAILAGSWVSNAGNVISLPGYSYEAVHFALCHIYSGASHPPEGISLMELAAIADLLGLVGLREVTAYALKVNYCHNFHKPCLGCIEGILQVLPVALNHGLDDLYRKCLKWTCKHYLKIWPTRTFASLSSDLRHRCQQQITAHLCSENVLTTILDCENLLAVVAPLRWGAPVETVLHEISDTAQIYLSEHFSSLIASDSFLSLGHDQSCNIPALENLLMRTASTLNPDQACRSYQRVTKLHQVLHSKILTQQQNKIRAIVEEDEEDMDWDMDFIGLVGGMLSAVEQCLQRQCSRAMRTSAWQRLDLELRKKIQKLACLTDPLFERRQRANARQQQQQKAPVYQASYNRNQDIQQVRLAIHAHSKRSAQGYIIDQFTNNNHGGGGGGGQRGQQHSNQQYKSHSTTHTQTQHLNHGEGGGRLSKEKRDKSVQANNEIERGNGPRSSTINGAAKLEKSKSHSHVNGSSSGHQMVNKGGKVGGGGAPKAAIQRNASMSQVAGTNGVPRLRTDVKSRYMDISSKGHRTAQPANEAVRNVKQTDQFSSSGTSTRTPSPSVKRKAAPKNIDSHMSLDSLASPKKQPLHQHRSNLAIVHHDENSLSRDSLAESIRSSIRTEGTISQESLAHPQHTRIRLSVDNKVGARNLKNNQKTATNGGGGGGSTSGSTSSVGAPGQKSGRLMRNFSDSGVVFRNPGNASKGLSSNSSNASSARTSFLSKKSREILERRSLMENQPKGKDLPEKEVVGNKEEVRRSLPINKSSSTSNIPTHRRIFNTTLHLRKTAHLSIPERPIEMEPKTNGSAVKKREPQAGLKPSRIAQKVPQLRQSNGDYVATKGVLRKGEKSERDLMATEKSFQVLELDNYDDSIDRGFESKMVRSSTFSKDCPDLNLSIEIS